MTTDDLRTRARGRPMSTPIERAAEAVAEYMACGYCDGSCGDCTGTARAALTAALNVNELAAVLSTQTTCDGEPYPSELHYRLARAVIAHLTLPKDARPGVRFGGPIRRIESQETQ